MIERVELTKRYYTISEVASMFGVATSLLRFWETVFTTLRPVKSSRGERRYTPDMILHIQEIYILVKQRGYTLEGAKEALKNKRNNDKAKAIILSKLKAIRNRLEQLLPSPD